MTETAEGDEDGDLYPHYFSTYCIHKHHEDCRLTCKFCDERCRCICHQYA